MCNIYQAGVGAKVIDAHLSVDGTVCQTSGDNGNQFFLSVSIICLTSEKLPASPLLQ